MPVSSTMQNVIGPIRILIYIGQFYFLFLVGRITFYRRQNLNRSKSITRVKL